MALLLCCLPKPSKAQDLVLPGGGPGLVSVAAGSGVTVTTNGRVYTVSSSGGATAAGSTYSIQWNSNSTFAGNTGLQYFPIEWFGETFGPVTAINNGVATNVVDPYGMSSFGAEGLYFRTLGTDIKWNLSGAGHWVPWLSNSYDVGSWSRPVQTNWAVDGRFRRHAEAGPSPMSAAPISNIGGNPFYPTNSSLYISYSNSQSDPVTIDTVAGDSSGIGFRRSLGSFASKVDVTDGLQLGYIDWRGWTASNYFNVASMAGHADGTIVSGVCPGGRLSLFTSPGATGAIERIRINSAGLVSVNPTAGLSGIGAGVKFGVRQTDGTADYTSYFRGSTNSGGSYGFRVDAGTTSADGPMYLATADGATVLFQVKGNGDAYCNRNFGIGSTIPGATLDIKSSSVSQFLTSTGGTSIAYTEYINTGGSFRIGQERNIGTGLTGGSSAYAGIIAVQHLHPLQFATASTVKMTIDTNGNVGIGTPTPGSHLAISNAPGTTGTPLFHAGTNNTENGFIVSSNGMNVGIGTRTPSSTLDVVGEGRFATINVTNPLIIANFARIAAPSDGVITLYNNTSTGLDRLQFGGTDNSVAAIKTTNAHLKITDGYGNLTTATNGLWFQGQHWTGAIVGTNVTQQCGKVRLAAGSQSYYVTNNHITASSIVLATINSDDTTGTSVKAIVSAGLLQLKAVAAVTANCDISWFIASP